MMPATARASCGSTSRSVRAMNVVRGDGDRVLMLVGDQIPGHDDVSAAHLPE
jgi:hypothetical protein